jgi:hypothetical protein
VEDPELITVNLVYAVYVLEKWLWLGISQG